MNGKLGVESQQSTNRRNRNGSFYIFPIKNERCVLVRPLAYAPMKADWTQHFDAIISTDTMEPSGLAENPTPKEAPLQPPRLEYNHSFRIASFGADYTSTSF